MELPLTPFELTAPVLGLLLVFRTHGYDRFNAGSDASWEVTGRLRSIIRLSWSHGPPLQMLPPAERIAADELIDACCLLHGWLMTAYLRGEPSAGQQAALMRATLGAPVSEDAHNAEARHGEPPAERRRGTSRSRRGRPSRRSRMR